ncbi:hypothetical protein ACOMHN_012037 [Nucella lapillus]
MTDYLIRNAEEGDCEQIMKLVVELAEFEKMAEQVHINADVLRRDGFGPERSFHCLVAEATGGASNDKTMIGYCLYYYIYSIWEGKCCFMQDLYVIPQWRSKGIGTALWVEATKIALSKDCSLLNWTVLDWNTNALELYKRRGGINLTEKEGRLLFRMTKPAMQDFVAKNSAKP